MKKNYLIIICSCILLAACSSGKNRLEKGDYNTAVYKAVKRLQQKPNYNKAEKVLREAYTLAVNEHMSVIEYHYNTGQKFKEERMLHEYQKIDRMNNAIRRYPQYADLISLIDIKQELALTRKAAAQAHKDEGIELLALNSKQRAREAFAHFVKANALVNGVVSVGMLDQAQEAGTVNVILEFVSGRSSRRNFSTDKVFNQVSNNFKNTRFRFLRVVEYGETEIIPDEIVQIEMDEAHVSNVDFSKNVYHIKKDDVHIGQSKTDSGEVVKVYGTVTAKYIEFCKTISSRARLRVVRMDGESLTTIENRTLPSTYNWSENWATYRGDKRALSKQQLDMSCRTEPNPPSSQWLFAQTTKPLVGRSLDYLHGQYNYLR